MIELVHVALSCGSREVLSDIHVSLRGESALIVGGTGAGKSLLVRLLCGLVRPTRGSVEMDGLSLQTASSEELAAHRRKLALWPQRPELVESRTVIQNVALALEVQQWPAGRAWEKAGEALERAGCVELVDRPVRTLSIGERRLVGLARALAREDAPVLIADDPIAGLDPMTQERVGLLLAEQAERGMSVLVTSRAPQIPAFRPPRVGFLEDGRIVWSDPPAGPGKPGGVPT